jgi:two-component system response regulator PilR (NtrC family)
MESELFGHDKGAFTGAVARHLGIFREADGGTVLLDEVGELATSLQVKLLRVLQERKVRGVGASTETAVDVRVLAATNCNVEEDVKTGKFRQDLYYRLNVIRIEVPPLRARREDIPELAEAFLLRCAREHGKNIRGFEPDALRALDVYAFPGNVRELENVVERAVALATGQRIGLGDLPREIVGAAAQPTPGLVSLPEEGCNLDDVIGEVERRLILQALEKSGGVRTQAAKLLGVSFRSFRYRLQKHALGGTEDLDDEAGSGPADPT